MEALKNKSLIAFFICCSFLFSVTIYQQKQAYWGANNEISWDASGYYLYLPAVFYDHLSKLDNRQYIIDNYRPCGDDIAAHRSPLGKYVMKYSSGQAIMFFPGFVIAHFWAKAGGYKLDGFSAPYQMAMYLYSTLFCCIGLWFIRKVLLVYFEDALVACSLLILCFATNYLNFTTFSAMLTHGYLFTIYSIIIYLSIKWYNRPAYGTAALLGLLAGLAALTRPREVICIFIPLAWGVGNFRGVKERIALLLKQWPRVLTFLGCAVLVGSVQLIYWKAMSGHFLYWSYDDPGDGFNFIRVPVHACLFSYTKGWWVYTPVMILSAIGFVPLLMRRKFIFWPTLLFSLLALYLVFSWKNWSYGGSFSQRAVVQYYAVLIFPVTAFFEWFRNNIYAKAITILFCLFCVYLNLVMTWQANISGVMESDNMSKAYYWAIFGKPNVPRIERKLIDTDEELPESLKSQLKTIYWSDTAALSANHSDTIFEGKRLFVNDSSRHNTPFVIDSFKNISSGWFRINTTVSIRQWEGNYWRQPYMHAALVNQNGEQIKFKSYYIQRILTNDSINRIFIDIKVPEGVSVKGLRGGIDNNNDGKVIFVGPFWVEYAH